MRDITIPGTPEENIPVLLINGNLLGPALGACHPDILYRLAVKHKIISPLAFQIEQDIGIDPVWRRWAAVTALAWERDAGLWAIAAKKTVSILESEGILPILLKGVSLSLGRPRDTGDIDLLIPADSLIKAISLLEANGYEYKGFDRNMYIRRREYRNWEKLARWSNQFEFREPDTGALIELHTAFFETERVYSENLSPLRAAVDEFACSCILDKATGYRFLSLEDRVLLLALHAGLKRSPGRKEFIFRHMIDLQNLVDKGLDWKKLAQRALQFKAAHHLVFLLRLFEFFTASNAPEGFVEELESRLPSRVVQLQRLHLRCLTGLDSYNPGAIFLYRLISPFILNGTFTARLHSLLIFPLFFPSYFRLSQIYSLPPRLIRKVRRIVIRRYQK